MLPYMAYMDPMGYEWLFHIIQLLFPAVSNICQLYQLDAHMLMVKISVQ